MGRASYSRHNFQGGEWSKYAQGRADKQEYTSAMDLCYNGLPVEEGAWTRRPGTIQVGTTRNGGFSVIRQFEFESQAPYQMEFSSDGHLRFFTGTAIVSANEVSVTALSAYVGTLPYAAMEVTYSAPHGLAVGNQIVFRLVTQSGLYGAVANLFGRQFSVVAVPDTTHVVVVDSVFGDFDALSVSLGSNVVAASQIVEFATPYGAADLQNIRVVQNDTYAVVLCAGHPPYIVTQVSAGTGFVPGQFAAFTFAKAVFQDGPYLDPPTDGSTLTASGLTGAITLTASGTTAINGGLGFLATDVGRLVRLFSEPAAWANGTAYSQGAVVSYNGAYYSAIKATTNEQPDVSPASWAIDPTAGVWTWGTILSVTSNTVVSFQLSATAHDAAGTQLAGGPLLYAGVPIKQWRLGAFCDTTYYPANGTYHEGRLWLAGAAAGRFDGSVSNNFLAYYPTDYYGTVADNCAISETLQSDTINKIVWMYGDHAGLVAGTQGGEWAIQASSFGDPLTPTSIQAHKVTRFGCENIEPRRTGMSFVFVRRFGRKLTEYIADVYSGKYSGTNLSQNSAHLMTDGLAEIAYVQETTPIVWARTNGGKLLGMTYRRDSPFGTQPASFFGWHQHELGTRRSVVSLQAGPAIGGETDALTMVTKDPVTGWHFVELMTPIFLETDDIQDARFTDGGVNVTGQDLVTVDGVQYYRFYGAYYAQGQTVSVFVGGVDLGDYQVKDGGVIDVPVSAAGTLFSKAYLESLASKTARYPIAFSTPATDSQFAMSAEENYDPVHAADVDALAAIANGKDTNFQQQVNYTCNEAVGFSFDRGRRKIMYSGFFSERQGQLIDKTYGSLLIPVQNLTGAALWDGENPAIPPFGIFDGSENYWPSIMEKDLDTGEIVEYPTFSPTAFVPYGIGKMGVTILKSGSGYTHATATINSTTGTGATISLTFAPLAQGGYCTGASVSDPNRNYTDHPTVTVVGDGTGLELAVTNSYSLGDWLRIGLDYYTYFGNSPILVNPRNHDVWLHMQSCELHQYRYEDNFAQVISPLYEAVRSNNNLLPFGIDQTWCYTLNIAATSYVPSTIVLTPAEITSDEFTADQKLKYAEYSLSGAPWPAQVNGLKTTFGTDGNLYMAVLNAGATAQTIQLLKFVPPVYAPYGSVTGGTFTDITPWGPSTGPNLTGSVYTNRDGFGVPTYPTPGDGFIGTYHDTMGLWRLPSTNQAVLVSSHYKEQYGSSGSTDYSKTVFDATYLQLGASPAMDHHPSFVTGYMTANWVPTATAANAAWAVRGWKEMDPYREASDFVYPGLDYSKRWIFFECYPVVNGVPQDAPGNPGVFDTLQIVAVQYKFVYGSAPVVLQIIQEQSWDVLYPDAQARMKTNLVYNSLYNDRANGNKDYGYLQLHRDPGLSDDLTSSFWFSGVNYSTWFTRWFDFDLKYQPRKHVNPFLNAGNSTTEPPFLKLTHFPVYNVTASASLGVNYTSSVRLVRPVVPQEAGSQNGPAWGKKRRTDQFSALLVNTQGINFGTDTRLQYSATLKDPDTDAVLPLTTLFTGTHWNSLEDDFSFDSQLAWSCTRPYPATVAAVEGFLTTSDR